MYGLKFTLSDVKLFHHLKKIIQAWWQYALEIVDGCVISQTMNMFSRTNLSKW